MLLIDGGSGSGKTTLAHDLAERWPSEITVVSLDAFYPGWGGLLAASEMVARDVLHPTNPGYRRWDWQQSRPAEWVPLDPDASLIIEGCGALTPANRALATSSIWMVAPEPERRERALTRDGDMFAPHWDEWARQERVHWRRHRPRELADWWHVDGRLVRRRATIPN